MAINITDDGASIKLDINPAYNRDGYNLIPQQTILIPKESMKVRAQDSDIYIFDGSVTFRFLYTDITSPNPAVYTSAVAMAVQIENIKDTGSNVGGYSNRIKGGITTSSTAYTANDNIGGIITLTNILRTSGGTGIISDVSFWALANQKPNLYLDFWDASPSGTFTNDSAQIIAGDQIKHLAFIEISTGEWKDTGVIARCNVAPIGKILKGNNSRSVFMTIQDKTGVTFGSTAGLFYNIGILQD